MSIFRRKQREERPEEVDDTLVDTEEDADAPEAEAAEDTEDAAPAAARASAPADRSSGPYDAAEVDDEVERLDLGGLRLSPAEGVELRLEIEQETQQLVSVMAVKGSSQVQLSAFAAPRTSGIWDEIRDEITESVLSAGGTAQTQDGPFGTELLARIPSQGPDSRTVFAPARFIGVDGPRWFLRAVLYGPAARAEEAAEPLLEFLRGVVVVRGDQAMAPREMLPLALPAGAGDQPEAAEVEEEQDEQGPRRDDLKPFERGPEITEVR